MEWRTAATPPHTQQVCKRWTLRRSIYSFAPASAFLVFRFSSPPSVPTFLSAPSACTAPRRSATCTRARALAIGTFDGGSRGPVSVVSFAENVHWVRFSIFASHLPLLLSPTRPGSSFPVSSAAIRAAKAPARVVDSCCIFFEWRGLELLCRGCF